jgi:aminopeptidase N
VRRNGGPTARRSDGTAVWTFARTPPLPPYLIALAAGPFRRVTAPHGDLRLTLYARETLFDDLTKDADELFEVITRGLDFSAGLLDRPYPFAKYDHVFGPECAFTTVAHPGCVVFDERLLFRSKVTRESRRCRAEALLSAMAHMWFGGLVTSRWWNDLWLTDGLATLISAIAQSEATSSGGGRARFEYRVCSPARQEDRLPESHAIARDTPGIDAADFDLDPIMAKKTAAVLRQLAEHSGWENFRAGLRRYLHDHAWSAANLGDFIRVLERSGNPGPARWATEWLRRPGIDTVEVHRLPSGRTALHLSDPQAPRVRLRIGCYSGDLRVQHRVSADLDQRGTSENETAGAQQVVLPNNDGMAYVRVRLDPASRGTVMSRLSALGDPTARAVAWGTLWDDVLDARLPARAFVATVLAHARAEEDNGVLGLLWERAVAAAQVFGAPANRSASLRAIAGRIREELDSAPAGGDRQLTLVHALISSMIGEGTLLLDIVRGRRTWPGLVADRDLHWRVLLRLAAQGKPIGDLLAAELSAEPGDDDRRRALTIEAAQPDPRAKSQAWHRMFSDAYSLAERRAIMAGFPQHGQEDVLTPYAERYFLALDRLWGSAGPDSALAMVRTLYPLVTNAEHEVLARTDEIVEQGSLPTGLLRVLRRKRAELAFIVAARRRDAAPAGRPRRPVVDR